MRRNGTLAAAKARAADYNGETLAQYHAREAPIVTLGDRLPRVRCDRTPSLFSQADAADQDREKWTDRQGTLL